MEPFMRPDLTGTLSPVQYSASTAEPMKNQEINLQERLQQLIAGSREGWTYGIFWQSSGDYSGSSLLGWGDGYYEGERDRGKAIMTISSAAEQEHRKKVLRELNSLISTPDDILDEEEEEVTDTEWLFLVSMTQSFYVNGGGLPIQAYFSNSPVWVSGTERLANSGCERASQGLVFGLQTLVCIPLANGVVELGSTEIINQNSDLLHKLGSLWKEECNSSCWPFWRRLYITCDSSLLVSDVQIGGKVQESILLREQNEKKRRKSKVWDEFTKSKGEDGEELAICNHCGGEFDGSSKNGTTHLRKHLESMKCRAKRNGGDGNGDKSIRIRDLASVNFKEKSYVLTMEESIVMKEQNEKKKRKSKSKVWDEFKKSKGEDGKQWAICNNCGRKFDGSSEKGTTHLRNHLESMKCRSKAMFLDYGKD